MSDSDNDLVPGFPTAIESELRCRECGYILRGLRFSDACPECGTIIQGSSRSGAYARRLTYVDKVCRILWMLLAGCGLFIIGTAEGVPMTSNSADSRKLVAGVILERVSALLVVVALTGSAALMFWPEFRKRKSAWLGVSVAMLLSLLAWVYIPCN